MQFQERAWRKIQVFHIIHLRTEAGKWNGRGDIGACTEQVFTQRIAALQVHLGHLKAQIPRRPGATVAELSRQAATLPRHVTSLAQDCYFCKGVCHG